jgi:hypothetical protein
LAAGCDNPTSARFLTPLERLPLGAIFFDDLRVLRDAMTQTPIESFQGANDLF